MIEYLLMGLKWGLMIAAGYVGLVVGIAVLFVAACAVAVLLTLFATFLMSLGRGV